MDRVLARIGLCGSYAKPRCLIPRFDAVILSQGWKEATWNKVPSADLPAPYTYSHEVRSWLFAGIFGTGTEGLTGPNNVSSPKKSIDICSKGRKAEVLCKLAFIAEQSRQSTGMDHDYFLA